MMILRGMVSASAPRPVRMSSMRSRPTVKRLSPWVVSRLSADRPSWLWISMSSKTKQKTMESSVVSSSMVGSFESV